MNITCPECSTNFTVSQELIGECGRKVKCSKCSYIWHQYLENQIRLDPTRSKEVITDNKTIKSNGVNLPALLPIRMPQSSNISPLILISLILFLSLLLFHERLGINLSDDFKDLNINDIKIVRNIEEGKIIINYNITNMVDQTISIPLIRVRLFDKDNKLIDTQIVKEENLTLGPKKYINLQSEFFSNQDATTKIDISLGNKLDFILK